MGNKAKFEKAVAQFYKATETIDKLFKELNSKDLTPELDEENYANLYDQFSDGYYVSVYYTNRQFESCIGYPIALLNTGEIVIVNEDGDITHIGFSNLESLADKIKIVEIFL